MHRNNNNKRRFNSAEMQSKIYVYRSVYAYLYVDVMLC